MPAAQLGVTGIINANGTVKEAFENFKSERLAAGDYRITYKPEFIEYASPGVTPMGNNVGVSMSEVSKKGFRVKFPLLLTLLLTDTEFAFQCIGE
jgi:hypothetical protein